MLFAGALLALALGAATLLGGQTEAQTTTRFCATVTNATNPEMIITPGAYLGHQEAGAFQSSGGSANLALERIAEIGDPSTAVADLNATALDTAPANGDQVTFEFEAQPGDLLSFAQMLIATNGAFVGVNSLEPLASLVAWVEEIAPAAPVRLTNWRCWRAPWRRCGGGWRRQPRNTRRRRPRGGSWWPRSPRPAHADREREPAASGDGRRHAGCAGGAALPGGSAVGAGPHGAADQRPLRLFRDRRGAAATGARADESGGLGLGVVGGDPAGGRAYGDRAGDGVRAGAAAAGRGPLAPATGAVQSAGERGAAYAAARTNRGGGAAGGGSGGVHCGGLRGRGGSGPGGADLRAIFSGATGRDRRTAAGRDWGWRSREGSRRPTVVPRNGRRRRRRAAASACWCRSRRAAERASHQPCIARVAPLRLAARSSAVLFGKDDTGLDGAHGHLGAVGAAPLIHHVAEITLLGGEADPEGLGGLPVRRAGDATRDDVARAA